MAIELLRELVSRPSITPNDAGCQELISARLAASGFVARKLNCNAVSNLWLKRGMQPPLFVFAGHTDVVPPGDYGAWRTPPFSLYEENGMVYGRGVADMKGGIVAAVTACERFVQKYQHHCGSIALLLTSDEEGAAIDGTRYAMKKLNEDGEIFDACVVIEPSSQQTFGDTIRHGRRGSISAKLTVHGRQGHIAYPDKIDNPIHAAAPLLTRLSGATWDSGDDNFPPTSFQWYRVAAGANASNTVPGTLCAEFNLRFSPQTTAEKIQERVEQICQHSKLHYELEWQLSAQPFLSEPGPFTDVVQKAIHETTGRTACLSTGGGTSDARFIAPYCKKTLEVGLLSSSIHQPNEHIRVAELLQLIEIYQVLLEKMLIEQSAVA